MLSIDLHINAIIIVIIIATMWTNEGIGLYSL